MKRRQKASPGVVWAYCRVSTQKDEQGFSLDEQIRWAQSFAANRGASLQVFKEKASAKTIIGRPVCSRMLALLEDPTSLKPEILAATSFDRLSRDMTDTLLLARALRTARVQLYIRDRGEVPMDSFADQAALCGTGHGRPR
ncbi:MAG: recombinase family protein [Vulcanimicrobiaceae bacterium]